MFVGMLALVPFAFGQRPDSVKLKPIKQLRKGVDAWPLIADASTPAERNINATLTRLNERMVKSLVDCDRSYREWAKMMDQPLAGKDAQQGSWEREITITMTGPGFLSMVAKGSAFCGGAHPDDDTRAIVFDLTTGRPVDWVNLIAESAKASTYSDSNSDGTEVHALIVPGLQSLTIAHASEDCKDAFDDRQSYQLWPDAKSGTLVAEPFGLAHAVVACADDLRLTLDQAGKLGFDEMLLSTIAQAHRKFVGRLH